MACLSLFRLLHLDWSPLNCDVRPVADLHLIWYVKPLMAPLAAVPVVVNTVQNSKASTKEVAGVAVVAGTAGELKSACVPLAMPLQSRS